MATLLAELGYPGAADQATVHWVISHPEIEILIAADQQDKAVGMVTFSHRPQLRFRGRMATIEELVISPAWRRRGVGRELVRRVVDRARSLGVKQVELITHHAANEEVRSFCEACGFGEAPTSVYRLKDTGRLAK